jgi:transcriptional regulator with XRE-family HTH domain
MKGKLFMQLVKVLEERKMSKLQLAMNTGIAPHYLYNAINGKMPFYPKYKKAIAEFLQMDEQELFSESEANNNE